MDVGPAQYRLAMAIWTGIFRLHAFFVLGLAGHENVARLGAGQGIFLFAPVDVQNFASERASVPKLQECGSDTSPSFAIATSRSTGTVQHVRVGKRFPPVTAHDRDRGSWFLAWAKIPYEKAVEIFHSSRRPTQLL